MADESVREIESDIEATRNRLYGTIDQIQQKLTVSGIVDEVMGSAGVPRSQNGHDFILGLMRRHPVPVMIAAAGIGWVVYRMNQRRIAAAADAIADAEYVEVPAVTDGRSSVYVTGTPEATTSHDIRRSIEAQA